MTKTEIRREIKKRAKQQLKGSWGVATGAWVVPVLIMQGIGMVFGIIMIIVSIISAVVFGFTLAYNGNIDPENFTPDLIPMLIPLIIVYIFMIIITILVSTPISLGTTDWYYSFAKGDKKPLGFIFNWIKSWKKIVRSLGVMWALTWRQIVFVCPWIAIASVFYTMGTKNASNDYTFIVIGSLFFIVFLVSLLFVSVRYGFAQYAVVDNPALKGGEAAKLSFKITKGHFWETVVFFLTYAVWYIPIIISFILRIISDQNMNTTIYSQAKDLIYPLILLFVSLILLAAQLGLSLYITPRILTTFSAYARYLIHGSQEPDVQISDFDTKPMDPINPMTSYPEI